MRIKQSIQMRLLGGEAEGSGAPGRPRAGKTPARDARERADVYVYVYVHVYVHVYVYVHVHVYV